MQCRSRGRTRAHTSSPPPRPSPPNPNPGPGHPLRPRVAAQIKTERAAIINYMTSNLPFGYIVVAPGPQPRSTDLADTVFNFLKPFQWEVGGRAQGAGRGGCGRAASKALGEQPGRGTGACVVHSITRPRPTARRCGSPSWRCGSCRPRPCWSLKTARSVSWRPREGPRWHACQQPSRRCPVAACAPWPLGPGPTLPSAPSPRAPPQTASLGTARRAAAARGAAAAPRATSTGWAPTRGQTRSATRPSLTG
jgi:hypothetical protein